MFLKKAAVSTGLAFAVFAIGGCVSKYTMKTAPDFNAEAFHATLGTGEISGEAFVRTVDGDVKTAAGLPVRAIPVTEYTTELYNNVYLQNRELANPPESKIPAVVVTANSRGEFTIKGLAPGKYYVVSHISWQYMANSYTGAYALAEAVVENGKTTKVIVTR
jgi:hypothetical protein